MRLLTLFVAGGLLLCRQAPADVLDSAAGGFTVKVTLNVQATPHAVYMKLLRPADWWNSAHTWSQDAHNLTLDSDVRGCFCEKLPNGGSVRHMDVAYVDPDKKLILRGALGPFLSMPAIGSMQIVLTPAEGGTKLEVTFGVGGYAPGGMAALAAPVNQVVTEQFTRLKEAIEHGAPVAGAPKK